MDRRYELENLRLSISMLTPGVLALAREDALLLLEEMASLQERLDQLRSGLRRLLDHAEERSGSARTGE